MTDGLNDVFADVAQECYSRAKRSNQGSEEADTAEHALDLLLDRISSDAPKAFLLHDVLANARYSVRRSRVRFSRAVESSGHLAARGIATGASRGFVEVGTPEDSIYAKDLLWCLQNSACDCGAHGPKVLSGLLKGATTQEMAEAAGVSPATVARTVRTLRHTVIAAGYAEAA
jgi:hypothetical protein